MKPCKSIFHLSCLLLGASGMAHAGALTWNVAGGGNWDTSAANWTGDSTVFTDGGVDSVTFSDTAGGIISIAADMTPSSVTVNAASGTYEFTGGPIDGSGGLTKSGAGILTLSGGNTYSGTTLVSNGVLKLNNATALGGGVLNFGGNIGSSLFPVIGLTSGTFTRTIVNAGGGINWNNAAGGFAAYGGDRLVNFGGAGAAVSWSFSLRFGIGLILGAADADGTVVIQNGINLNSGYRTIHLQNGSHAVDAILAGALNNSGSNQPNSFMNVQGAGTLAITGTSTTSFNSKVDSNVTLTIGNGGTTGSLLGGTVEHYGTLSFNRSDAMTFANTIGSAPGQNGQVRQIGAGTTTLTASNIYTGATTVSAGTLLVNGDQSTASGNVTVAASATLGGTGTIGGSITVANGANLAPGASTGTLTASANATINGNLVIEIDDAQSPKCDTLAVTGTLEITSATLNLAVTGTPTQAAYVIATYGVLTPASGPFATINGMPSGYEIDYAYNSGPAIAIKQIGGSNYAAWKTANATSQTIDQDHDGDGVSNGIEFFLVGPFNSTGFNSLPGVNKALDGTLSVTWTKATSYVGTYGTDFRVETSDTLTGTWTQEDVPPTPGATVTISGNNVTYTFPGGPAYSGKKFARLKVTGP